MFDYLFAPEAEGTVNGDHAKRSMTALSEQAWNERPLSYLDFQPREASNLNLPDFQITSNGATRGAAPDSSDSQGQSASGHAKIRRTTEKVDR